MCSARVASWSPFWTLLASLLGAFWPPRWLKPVLEFLLERPRAVQEYFFRPQERPKSRPRASRKPLDAPPWPTEPSPGLQEAPERPPGPIWHPCWLHFGAIWQPCWHHFATILEPCWSHFEASLPSCSSRFLADGCFAKGHIQEHFKIF